MKLRHMAGAVFVLVAGALLAYLGILTYMQYEDTDELDWPMALRGKGFSGTVVNASDTNLEMEAAPGKTEKFVIDRGTKMMLGEDKLTPGMYVKVIYKETKQMNIAKSVRKVRRAKTEKENASPSPEAAVNEEKTPDDSDSPEEPDEETKME